MKPDWFVGAEFDEGRKYRYRLWRRWSPDFPIAYWIMLNPSTADEMKDDPTIRRCINFTRSWGCGGMEVVNLFAFRSKAPDSLLTCGDPVGPRNDEILQAIAPGKADRIIAAWGAFPQRLGHRDKHVYEMLKLRNMLCLGMTLKGYPRHPLYVPSETKLEPFMEDADRGRQGDAK